MLYWGLVLRSDARVVRTLREFKKRVFRAKNVICFALLKVFVSGLWPPNSSYEQTNIFLLSCAAATIAAIVFSKGAPYRKPIYTNRIMGVWTVAAVATTVFMSIYDTEDFRVRMNMKIAPSLEYKLVLVFIMVANFLFCYLWEVISKEFFV